MDKMQDRFFKVHGWMAKELGLSGNRLLVYALIYGFENGYTGSLDYISSLTGCAMETVCRMLAKMVKEGILRKTVETVNGRKKTRYEVMAERKNDCHNVKGELTKRQEIIDKTSNDIIGNNMDDKRNIIKERTNEEDSQTYTEDFLKVYRLLGKGSKMRAWERWKKLTEEEKKKVEEHIGHYIRETDRRYMYGLESYLRERKFDDPVYYNQSDRNVKRYDPDSEKDGYIPSGDVVTDEYGIHYLKYQWCDGMTVLDGYNDDNRPDGVVLNMYGNWDYAIKWNAKEKTWKKI